ncbi:ABC transporter substrate-binding protein [Rhodomicrobium vannielii ATCC 17100]|uniref:ABC transporter substrate-binding protein n=1 Tax=Rhodomicrobium vannielii TaxID=1069 RepID=UPI00191ABD79|nr:ABC transporter substrate-binding protein [Rhodomicrobium vannielii ATCC 17100]
MIRLVAACAMLVVSLAVARAADAPRRIVSINLCTDQLLLTLADADQIAGLSPYSRDASQSWLAKEARAFPKMSGGAEDALVAEPDLVLAGRFTRLATRQILKAKGVPVAQFDVARSIDDAKEQIRRMAALVGHPERAEPHIARIDAALARAHAAASRTHPRVLAVSRRGWVFGGESLTTSLLGAAGLANAAGDMGLAHGGFASLEAIVMARPDFILVTNVRDRPQDQGEALLVHPALQKLYPLARRMVIPERLTTCGGPMLAEALDSLAAQVSAVETSKATPAFSR